MKRNQSTIRKPFGKKLRMSVYCCLILLLCSASVSAQSYIQDAKNLARLQELVKLNGGNINAIFSDEFMEAVVQQMNGDGLQLDNTNFVTPVGQGGQPQPQGGQPQPQGGQPQPQFGQQAQAQPAGQAVLSEIIKNEFDAEIALYEALLEPVSTTSLRTTFVANTELSSKGFKFLKATIDLLERNQQYGDPTSAGIVGSLLGVSQAEILQGITDWALSRAQEELMQSFLREWLEKLQQDKLLRAAFPNSLTMLETSDLSSLFTDGETWKATFKKDLDGIPDNAHTIAALVIEKLKINVKPEAKKELIAGLTAITRVFGEVNKNKKPDEILLLLGEETFLNRTKSNAIINRGIVGLNIFLKAIQHEDNNQLKYVLPNEILQLDQSELEMLWKLLFLGEKDKLKFVFNIADGNEAAFFSHIHTNVQQLKLQIVKASEVINNINTILDKVSQLDDENKTLSIDLFHSYVTLIFDLVENGLDGLSILVEADAEKKKFAEYKTTYNQGIEYIMLLHEGVKTKKYGQVALHTVNFINWIKNFSLEKEVDFTTENTAFKSIAAVSKINELDAVGLSKSQIEAILDKTQEIINEKLKKFKQIQALVQTRFDALKKKVLDENFQYTPANIKSAIQGYVTYSDDEKRIIVKDLAAEGLSNFNTSSAAFNKYTKLMASVILAEDSDDIKEALDAVAMKTGGYMVKQKSYFSTTVTFYPGIEYGTEQLKNDGIQDTDGTYLGANLPIGVEFAWGLPKQPLGLGSVGIFVQVLDLGAVLNYSLSNDNDDVSTTQDFGFKEVLSPGAYLTLHVKNLPITLGLGASYSPSLREITNEGITTSANALQYGVFVAVDLNVFTIFGSRKKIPLSSTSKLKAYEDE